MLRRIPDDLPLFGALAVGLPMMAFGFTAMYVELWVGRPSSTSSLGFIFIPIWAAVAALVGLAVGFIVRAIWRRVRVSDGPERRTWALLVMLPCLVLLAASVGAFDVIQAEERAKPRVRFDSGLLTREFRSDSKSAVRSATTLYDSDREPTKLTWGNNTSELRFGDDRIFLLDTVSGKNVEINTDALNYITRVDGVHLVSKHNSPPLLAVVISGRATGRRAVITIIDQNYKVVFEEQVERFWELKQIPLEIRADPLPLNEYIVVGPGCDRSIILRPKNAA